MRLFSAIAAACILIAPPAFAQSAPTTPSATAPKAKGKRVEPPSPGQSRMEILARKSDRLGKQMENSVCKC